MPRQTLPSLIAVSVMLALGAGCQTAGPAVAPSEAPSSAAEVQTQPMPGSDRDAHGCIGSAGYQWCAAKNKCLRIWEEPCLSALFPSEKVSVLTSTEDPNKFCNGADMDSAGFGKTLTQETEIAIPNTAKEDGERIKAMLAAATGERCQNIWQNATFTAEGDTITVSPVDAWAGVSITLCSCKPQIETNLLRLPGIKKVVWQ